MKTQEVVEYVCEYQYDVTRTLRKLIEAGYEIVSHSTARRPDDCYYLWIVIQK